MTHKAGLRLSQRTHSYPTTELLGRVLAAHDMDATSDSIADAASSTAMQCDWHTREDARHSIFRYIEVWYNRKRRHSTLGYVSPAEYEDQLGEAA